MISAAISATLIVGANAASIGGAKVNVSDLNFRSSADLGSNIFTTVPKDSLVVVGDKVGTSWYKVVYRGTVGYMAAEHVSFSETMDGSFGSGTIRGNTVRFRSEPNTNSSIFATYDHGTKMDIIGVSGNWYKATVNGATGYVHSDFIALNGGVADFTADTAATVSSVGQQIVDTAMGYMGVPYVWGGTSPSGFDCSGLVYYVYKQHGYSINRTAASIYLNGTHVDKENLQVGDAICFSTSSSSIGHVGIYIGNDQFVHASSGTGSVTVTSLYTDYYVRNYVGARRIV